MSNVQLRKRFALLVLNLSDWQDTFPGHWKLGTGHLFFSRPPAFLKEHHPTSKGSTDPEEIGFKRRISNDQQGMSNVQLRKRFALLVLNLSDWQDTFPGHWKLGTGNWTFVFQPASSFSEGATPHQ
jgi:hypothetical protein